VAAHAYRPRCSRRPDEDLHLYFIWAGGQIDISVSPSMGAAMSNVFGPGSGEIITTEEHMTDIVTDPRLRW
jgi:hypothetical protein